MEPKNSQKPEPASDSPDWWDEISDGEKQAIDEGISQMDRGEGIPHAEFRKRIDAMLGR